MAGRGGFIHVTDIKRPWRVRRVPRAEREWDYNGSAHFRTARDAEQGFESRPGRCRGSQANASEPPARLTAVDKP
jgi:hypothetical protein